MLGILQSNLNLFNRFNQVLIIYQKLQSGVNNFHCFNSCEPLLLKVQLSWTTHIDKGKLRVSRMGNFLSDT